jgi:subtilisin-like proprotein convertase family protein
MFSTNVCTWCAINEFVACGDHAGGSAADAPDGAVSDALPVDSAVNDALPVDGAVNDALPVDGAVSDATSDAQVDQCTPNTMRVSTSPALILTDNGISTSTVAVADAGNFLVGLQLTTAISHTAGSDLDIVLVSPRGTRVLITSDNGGNRDDVFNGTVWTDTAATPATDAIFVDTVVSTPLAPESALAVFVGEDPNGDWTLEITDDATSDTGTLNSWELQLIAVAGTLIQSPQSFTSTQTVATIDTMTVISEIPVTGAPTEICDVNVTTLLEHTASNDIDMAVIAPSGTRVVLTTDNGAAFDNIFNGTVWDDNVNQPAADLAYQNGVLAPSLTPEGALGRFAGENANGTWTLEITDDASGDSGTLNGWSLEVSSCTCQ